MFDKCFEDVGNLGGITQMCPGPGAGGRRQTLPGPPSAGAGLDG